MVELFYRRVLFYNHMMKMINSKKINYYYDRVIINSISQRSNSTVAS